jgi:hypothetical protein
MLLKTKNAYDKSCGENQNTFIFNIFPPENRTVYEIMWENMVQLERPQMTI